MKTLSQILKHFNLPQIDNDISIANLSLDSREIQHGDLFCAYCGDVFDGHNYIEQAIANGAVAILCERQIVSEALPVPVFVVPDLYQKLPALAKYFYDYPSSKLKIFGVTGTNGKTSVSYYLAQALTKLVGKCGYIGTIGYGVYGEDFLENSRTTPDVLTLNKWLAKFVDKGVKNVVMEVASHALSQNRVDMVAFEAAIFTNLTQDHLDYHGNMAKYAQAKAKLFAKEKLKYALINIDDEYCNYMIEACHDYTKIITFSCHDKNADIYLKKHKQMARGYEIEVVTKGGTDKFLVPLIGVFNIENVIAVVGVLFGEGYNFAKIIPVVKRLKPAPGRMEFITSNKGVNFVIDFAHTPDALEQVLLTLRDYCHGKIIAVFGCGGDRDKGKRAKMGAVASRLADYMVLTEDNSRSENPQKIIDDILAGVKKTAKVRVKFDRAQAIEFAANLASKDDIILLAGKGREKYIETNGIKKFFDDRQEACQVPGPRRQVPVR